MRALALKYSQLRRNYGGAVIGLMDQGFVSAVTFLTIVLLARHMPLAALGVFLVAQTLLTLLTTLQNALVTQPHNILGAQRSGAEYARLTVTLGTLQLVSSLLLAIVVAAVGVAFFIGGRSDLAQLTWALAVIVLPWMLQEFVRRILYTEGDALGAAVNDWISYGLQLIGIVALVTRVGGVEATPVTALYMMGASSLFAVVLGLWQLQALGPALRATLAELRTLRDLFAACAETWRLSRWLLAQQSIAWLGASGHGWILTALLGPATFGLYRAAYQVVNLLNPLRQAANNHLPSRAARLAVMHGTSYLFRWQRRLAWQLGLPFTVCAVAIVLLAEPIARVMYGLDLQVPDIKLFVALGALSFVLNFLRAPLDYALLAAGGAPLLFRRTVWLTVFVLSGGALLIWRFGIFGALISEIVTALLAAVLALRAYNILAAQSTASGVEPARRLAPTVSTIASALPFASISGSKL